MNDISTTSNQVAMMSSREIAELTGKEHKNIIRDIWEILNQLYQIQKDGSNLSHHKNQYVTLIEGVVAVIDNRGYVSEFLLDRRHTEILITGYDVVRRAAVIDRWFALESGKAIPVIQQQSADLPQLSKLEVLQMAIESEQGRLEEKARADKAELTKSQISRSREAQALGKLGAVTRKCRDLEERLGESTKHATITAVQNAAEKKYQYAPLRKWCRENNIEPTEVPDPRYGHVKSWPAEAWLAIHGVDLKKLFGKK
ncbi:Rha family transcriptional regulator [Xenorhabdus littoralis]|uniref:Rha family transcriptional regulator n=1 Tax=Xenorhabdus littoralis TaxID=2582835 RepID=UPI0029E825DF|nr:Rha family transcriptional regulator [Xenorhabdus sp. psl]MDX7992997.1 Rha family transcriptional regulator [Xenorhabdus sp. psl]